MKEVARDELQGYLDHLLEVFRWKDYCPNGLQVEGTRVVRKIVCGVTASQVLLDRAVELGADTVIVHHGYFWKGEDACLTGLKRNRLRSLLLHDMNLFAYHLPLDAHAELGNNAQLAIRFGWVAEGRFGPDQLGWIGRPVRPVSVAELAGEIASKLGRAPLVLGNAERVVKRIGWCSGAAQDLFETAIQAGVDAYLTGEVSERTYHLAMESGVPFIAAGHHATETFGVQALGEHLRSHFELDVEFVNLHNPV